MSRGLIKVIGSIAMAITLVASFGSVQAASTATVAHDGQDRMLPGVATSVNCLVETDRGPLGY